MVAVQFQFHRFWKQKEKKHGKESTFDRGINFSSVERSLSIINRLLSPLDYLPLSLIDVISSSSPSLSSFPFASRPQIQKKRTNRIQTPVIQFSPPLFNSKKFCCVTTISFLHFFFSFCWPLPPSNASCCDLLRWLTINLDFSFLFLRRWTAATTTTTSK